MKKPPARAFSPPTPRPKPMTDEEVKKMATARLADPNYQPEDAQVAVQATESPSKPAMPAKSSAGAAPKETPPDTAKSVEEAKSQEFPWDSLDGVKRTNLLYEIPPETVAKMNWVIDNVPKQSRQRIVRDGVAAELERLIALYYKP